MPRPEGIVMTAGAVSFAGNWKENGGFPPNGITIITATIVLVILASFARGSYEGPVRALAFLMLLAAAIRYIPGLSKPGKPTKKKDKKNG